MFNKNHIPDLYKKMNELGYLDYSNKHFIWMSEMEWMPYEEVMNYEYEEDMTKEVLPFAFMIKRYLDFEQMSKPIPWYLTDR